MFGVDGWNCAALAVDPDVGRRNGRVYASWTLGREYGFTDIDGTRPDWGAYFGRAFGKPWQGADDAAYASWWYSPYDELGGPESPKE